MTFSLTWLPEVLERAGLKVAETPNWRTRGRAEMGTVKGVICHHTATARGGNMPTLDMLIKGRSDLSGPLCHLGLGRDGTYYVVAAGRANHAGQGKWENETHGNTNFIGIEAENSGLPGDEWPEVQMDAYRRGVAAILKHVGAGANMVCGHKEYAPRRKTDPSFDMPTFRAGVAELLLGKSPPPPIPAIDASNRPTLRRGMRGDAVTQLQTALGLDRDGIFGGGTEAKVRAWQRAHALTPDGIFGPKSWELLDAQPAPAEPPAPPPIAPAVAAATVAAAADIAALPWAIRQIDPALMRTAFPHNTDAELKLWADPLRAACVKFEIDAQRGLCGFLANINTESNSLTTLSEGLNYSVKGLLATFGTGRISAADAQRLGRKPGERGLPLERQRAIANAVYGGAWGRDNLGNTQPDDGWTFRGYGPIQLTGRTNCARFGEAIGMAVDAVPAYIRTREGGCMSAAWFWRKHYLDKHPDPGTGPAEDRAMRTAVNTKALGFDVFEATLTRLATEFARRAKTDPPR